MTERLYYRSATETTFDARVVSVAIDRAGGPGVVVLDRTAFYPTSGGQPSDRGRLGDAMVVGVEERADDIVHLVEGQLEAGQHVTGEVDWPRRFDHMQQHSGQHILSAAFHRTTGIETASVHLGTDVSTIDLARVVSPEEIERAEAEANSVVWDDRPVTVRFVDAAEAARLPLRKETTRSGAIRLVEIDGVDVSACGGTHVGRTGAVGLIAVSAWERFKAGTRISFVCGGRALRAYRRLRDVSTLVGRELSVADDEIGAAVVRLRAEAKDRERRLADVEAELIRFQAAHWRDEAQTIGPLRNVSWVDRAADSRRVKAVAQAIVGGEGGLVAICVGGGAPAPVVIARSADVLLDANRLLRELVAHFGGRGGGRPELAQGGLVGEPDQIAAHARELLARSTPLS